MNSVTALQQPGSGLMSRASVFIKGQAEDWDLVSNPYYISVREPCQAWGHADWGNRCCHLESWRLSGTSSCLRSYLGPWAYRDWDLRWCLWLQLLTRALWIPGVWSATWEHVSSSWGLWWCPWPVLAWGLLEPCCAEPAPPFSGPGMVGPVLPWYCHVGFPSVHCDYHW